jgi:hypothetical protein
VKPAVYAACGDQFLMLAFFGDAFLRDDEDAVRKIIPV